MHALEIRLCKISILYTHRTTEVQFHNYTFLPYEHHLAGSVSQPESQTKLKSEDYARVQHQTNHGDV